MMNLDGVDTDVFHITLIIWPKRVPALGLETQAAHPRSSSWDKPRTPPLASLRGSTTRRARAGFQSDRTALVTPRSRLLQRFHR